MKLMDKGEIFKYIKLLYIPWIKILTYLNVDNSGSVDFKEFSEIMGAHFYKEPTKAELEEAFKYFDTDNSG